MMNLNSHLSNTPLIALISTSSLEDNLPVMGEQYERELSEIVWVLWRLGVERAVARDTEKKRLERVLSSLKPPPLQPPPQHPLLSQLIDNRRDLIRDDLYGSIPVKRSLQLLSIPDAPLEFDGVKLCFQDELIGDPKAFLIHYGASQFDVSGFHYPISAISVPIGQNVSALLIARLPYEGEPSTTRETCVMEINSRGELLKGPWWPRLDRSPPK